MTTCWILVGKGVGDGVGRDSVITNSGASEGPASRLEKVIGVVLADVSTIVYVPLPVTTGLAESVTDAPALNRPVRLRTAPKVGAFVYVIVDSLQVVTCAWWSATPLPAVIACSTSWALVTETVRPDTLKSK